MPERNWLKQFQHAYVLLKQASSKMEEQRYKVAKLILQNVLRVYPCWANALYLYSLCLQKQNPRADVGYFRSKSQELNSYYFQFMNEDDKKIITQISSKHYTANFIGNLKDSHGREWVNFLDSHLKQKDFDTCSYIFKLFELVKLQNDHYSDQQLSNIGVKYFEAGMYQESIIKHELAVAKSPPDVMYFNNLSILNYVIGNYQKSMEHANQTLVLEPNRVKTYYIQSFILIKQGKIECGMQKAQKAYDLNKSEPLFGIKFTLNNLLYKPHLISENKALLKNFVEMLSKGQKTKQYFSGDEAFPQFVDFLYENIDDSSAFKEDWFEYVGLFDDYLIYGLKDKLKIKRKMTNLRNKIVDNLIKLPKNEKEQHIQQSSTRLML